MKKIISILLILALLISIVPFSLAAYGQENGVKFEKSEVDDEDEDDDLDDVNETEDDVDSEDDDESDDVNETDDENEDDDEREGIQIGGKSRAKMRLDKVSEIALENIKRARENYLNARERYEEAKEKAKENKEKIKELKEELKKCKDDESDECSTVRNEAKNETKEFLGRSADAIIAALERVKARVQESDRFTEEEKAEMTSEIDAKIKEIEEAKASIENATTGKEIKEVAKKINAAWKNTKPKLEKNSHKTAIARFGNVAEKFEKVSSRLESAINKLAEEGKDTTELNTLKDNYNIKVQEVIDKLKEASDLVENEAYAEARIRFNEAKNILKEAHNVLKELVRKIKETGNDVVLEEQENE